ncbi:MAG: transposase [Bacteroidetes bacterium]|nr:transposase [Bacteroidota bacterium]
MHRQVQLFKSEKVQIPANTSNRWQDGISNLILPLFEKQKRLVLGQGYLQMDETPSRF